jgi:hypothetical protein
LQASAGTQFDEKESKVDLRPDEKILDLKWKLIKQGS